MSMHAYDGAAAQVSMETFRVVAPGLWTTVQDLGRPGCQRFGVPVGGALDTFALEAANRLAGNEPGAAALEITWLGPRLRVLADTLLAVAGADVPWEINGREAPLWQAVAVRKDDEIRFFPPRRGARAYVAVRGGVAVPAVMGSRSTFVRGGFGGLHGRPLRAGDVISSFRADGRGAGGAGEARARDGLRLPEELRRFGLPQPVRVLAGPQDDLFAPLAMERLLGATFRVSSQADRMGCRLHGPRLPYRTDVTQFVTDGTAPGSIQVPGDGRPIVLLADRQTSGGYPKIATVISADLDFLAQAWAGDRVTFRSVSLEEAHRIRRRRRALLDAVARFTETVSAPTN